jgi:hypothetical protein
MRAKGEVRMRRDHRVADWNPEDTPAWEAGNKKVARLPACPTRYWKRSRPGCDPGRDTGNDAAIGL